MATAFTLDHRRNRRPASSSTQPNAALPANDTNSALPTQRNVTDIIWKVLNTELISDIVNPLILSIVILVTLALYHFDYISESTIIYGILLRELKNCILRVHSLMKPVIGVMKVLYQTQNGRRVNL